MECQRIATQLMRLTQRLLIILRIARYPCHSCNIRQKKCLKSVLRSIDDCSRRADEYPSERRRILYVDIFGGSCKRGRFVGNGENGDKWGKAEDGKSRENGKKPRNLSEAASVKFLWELPPPWPESLSSEARKSAEGKFNRRNSTENVPGREDKT